MIDIESITFPLTLEAFTAIQKVELGRELNGADLEACDAIVAIANKAYKATTVGDVSTVQGIMDTITEATTQSPAVLHTAEVFRSWVILGHQKGLQVYSPATDGPA